jgi:hypothetical protein
MFQNQQEFFNMKFQITESDICHMVYKALNEVLSESGEDFGINVKGDLTEDDILKGEPLYHRPNDGPDDNPMGVINSLMKYGFSREYTGSNGGNMYGPGVYNVYTLSSSNTHATGYGRLIVKSYLLGGFKDFLCFDKDLAKKYYGTENNAWWIGNQIKQLFDEKTANDLLNRFGPILRMHTVHDPIKTSTIAYRITEYLGSKISSSKVRGIVYAGGHDGCCAFVRNFSDVIPYAYSRDNGRTWVKAITKELIWRAGHDTDVNASLKKNKAFDDTAEKSINGFVITYKKGKANYFEVAKNRLISDTWFDYAGNFNENGEAEASYNGHSLLLQREDDGNIIAQDQDEGDYYSLDEIPQMLSESIVKKGLLDEGIHVDNFDLAANLLRITNPDDFYYVAIVKRLKDNRDMYIPRRHNPDTRSNCIYLKSYKISSPDDLKNYRDEIINLCNQENARAMMTINPRSLKEVEAYVNHCKQKGLFHNREFEHAAGQAKDRNDRDNNWEEKRPWGLIDNDIPDPEAIKQLDDLLKKFNLTPSATYTTPNGGKHYIMPNRDAQHLNFGAFEKYRPKQHTRRNSDPMVLFKGDAQMILYSNV